MNDDIGLAFDKAINRAVDRALTIIFAAQGEGYNTEKRAALKSSYITITPQLFAAIKNDAAQELKRDPVTCHDEISSDPNAIDASVEHSLLTIKNLTLDF